MISNVSEYDWNDPKETKNRTTREDWNSVVVPQGRNEMCNFLYSPVHSYSIASAQLLHSGVACHKNPLSYDRGLEEWGAPTAVYLACFSNFYVFFIAVFLLLAM